MKTKYAIKKLFTILLILLMVISNMGISIAATENVEELDTNDPEIEGFDGYTFKIEDNINGIYTDDNTVNDPGTGIGNGNGLIIDVTFYENDGEYTELDWSSNNFKVYYVYVKAGSGGNLYSYLDGEMSDEGLTTPTNNKGKHLEISHVTFYYKQETPEPEGSIELTKLFEQGYEGNVTDEFKIDIVDDNEDGFDYTTTATITVDSSPMTIDGLQPGKYLISEQSESGYALVSIIEDGGNSVTSGALSVTVEDNDTVEVDVMNKKLEDPKPEGSISLEKWFEGIADEEEPFEITITDNENDIDYTTSATITYDDPPKVISGLTPGTYTISEVSKSGYELVSISDGSNTSTSGSLDVEVVDDQEVTVDITNKIVEVPEGTIKLEKWFEDYMDIPYGDVPEEHQDEEFDILIENSDIGYSTTATITFIDPPKAISGLTPGIYTISEAYNSGYELVSIDDGTTTSTSGSLDVEVTDGGEVLVNIINRLVEEPEEKGSITIQKYFEDNDTIYTNEDYEKDFKVLIEKRNSKFTTEASISVTDGAVTIDGLPLGSYDISEDLAGMNDFGFVSMSSNSEIGGDPSSTTENTLKVTINNNQKDVKVDITNKKLSGTIILNKNIVSSMMEVPNGDQVFNIMINDEVYPITADSEPTTISGLSFGDYAISEEILNEDYKLDSIEVNDEETTSGVITIDSEDPVYVDVNNIYDPVVLIITKDVINYESDKEFTIFLEGIYEYPELSAQVENGSYEKEMIKLGDEESKLYRMSELMPGVYKITEPLVPVNYRLVGIKGPDGEVLDNGEIYLGPEMQYDLPVEVVVENELTSSLTVEKVVTGRTGDETPFTIQVLSGEQILDTVTLYNGTDKTWVLPYGDYEVKEIDIDSDYTLSSITNGGNVTIDGENQNPTVVVTNNYDPDDDDDDDDDNGTTTTTTTRRSSTPDRGELTITKEVVDGNGDPVDVDDEIKFTIDLYRGSNLIGRAVLANGESKTWDLVESEYTIVETEIPEGYELEDISRGGTVDLDDNDDITITVTNVVVIEEAEDEEIPQAAPEVPVVEEEPEVEIELSDPPKDAPPALPQTGEFPPYLFYGLGGMISALGLKLRKKNR